jgi:hypothetical protein
MPRTGKYLQANVQKNYQVQIEHASMQEPTLLNFQED